MGRWGVGVRGNPNNQNYFSWFTPPWRHCMTSIKIWSELILKLRPYINTAEYFLICKVTTISELVCKCYLVQVSIKSDHYSDLLEESCYTSSFPLRITEIHITEVCLQGSLSCCLYYWAVNDKCLLSPLSCRTARLYLPFWSTR